MSLFQFRFFFKDDEQIFKNNEVKRWVISLRFEFHFKAFEAIGGSLDVSLILSRDLFPLNSSDGSMITLV
ncbi:hypothetical protein EAI96_06450 [Turicibacter sanguinis]|nr:hypothetical protein EAI96_06450 [Turicibacter sanguinis]